jgi:hypothetical protein
MNSLSLLEVREKRADELSTMKVTVLLNLQFSDIRDVISCAWDAV